MRKMTEEMKAERAAQKKAFLEYCAKPGAILAASWGYEQTNVEFFKVLEVKGSKVRIVEVGHVEVEGTCQSHGMACQVMPATEHTGEGEWKCVRSACVTLDFTTLYPWDGKSKYKSWYA